MFRGALLRVIDAGLGQARLLSEALDRPEVDQAALSRQSLHLLLEALRAESDRLLAEPSLDAAARQCLEQSSGALRSLHERAIQAREHLTELASGWRCGRCGTDVPRDAVVEKARSTHPALSLVCRSCEACTPVTRDGVRRFHLRFGHRFGPSWDPRKNGFIVGSEP